MHLNPHPCHESARQPLSSHIEYCDAMNVGNLRIHLWVITTHQEIVSHYIQYNDKKPFEPIELNYEVEDYETMKDTYGKLTALVVYLNNYFHTNFTKIFQIEFGLGKEFKVNAIIVIPTLKQRKSSISSDGNFLTSPLLQIQFPLIYKPANTGRPSSVDFEYKELIRPREVTSSGQTLVMNMSPDNTNINVN